ncbi:hypothetical protein [Burkholderia ubonensis]|nr:hypothetical protein [Burkholderia ubonensis]
MKRLVMLQALLAFAVFVLATALVSGRAQAVTPRETASSAEVGGCRCGGIVATPRTPLGKGLYVLAVDCGSVQQKTRKAKPGGVLL